MTYGSTIDVEIMAKRLLTAALNLEEAANTCAILPSLDNFHELLVCMRESHEALTVSFRELVLT